MLVFLSLHATHTSLEGLLEKKKKIELILSLQQLSHNDVNCIKCAYISVKYKLTSLFGGFLQFITVS